MALTFNAPTPKYLVSAGVPVSVVPMTLVCRFRAAATLTQTFVSLADSSVPNQRIILYVAGGNTVSLLIDAAATAVANTSTTITPGVLHSAVGVLKAVDDRSVYLDGGGVGVSVTSRAPTGLDVVGLGMVRDSSPSSPLTGELSEVAIYDLAWTADDAVRYALGYTPDQIRPEGLVLYKRMIRDEDVDLVGGLSFTASGSPGIASHPRVIESYPASVLAAPLRIPVAMRTYRNRRAG